MTDRFTCVRISQYPRWKEKVKGFENTLNPNLVDYIRDEAWDDDTEDWNAVYLVLDKNHA